MALSRETNMTASNLPTINAELTLERINEIPVLILNHSVGSARIGIGSNY